MISKKTPNPTDKHIGARIRMRRLMLGLSQEKLGDGLGLTFQQVQKYEKGTNRVGGSRMQQISNILKVPPGFFFEGQPATMQAKAFSDDSGSPAYIMDCLSTSDGLALVKAYMAIKSAKLRRSLVNMAEEIAAYRIGR